MLSQSQAMLLKWPALWLAEHVLSLLEARDQKRVQMNMAVGLSFVSTISINIEWSDVDMIGSCMIVVSQIPHMFYERNNKIKGGKTACLWNHEYTFPLVLP